MTMPTDSIKISQLPGATSSSPSDEFPLNQGGVTKKTSPALLSTDWKSLAVLPTATYLGQRSYSLTFLGIDYSGVLSEGMRMLFERITPSPVQSTLLNGTNQYWLKATPNKLTFTDDFVISAWVKLSSYVSFGIVGGRFNGSSGWRLGITGDGTVSLGGFNGNSSNYSKIDSVQTLPLNKWTHIAAQLDMSAYTATTTTSYIMIDGVNVPVVLARGGTNPTALVQAGNLEIGAYNTGTSFFNGKIGQFAIFDAKVAQSTMLGYMSQGLTGTETSLASAYSFDNNANDLNTTNPNNLTAQNAAGYTNESPFGNQADRSVSALYDYGIIQNVSGGTNTTLIVQVPEGCTIPTSGSLAAVSYSSVKVPHGFTADLARWTILTIINSVPSGASVSAGVWANIPDVKLIVPKGSWNLGYKTMIVWSGSSTTYAIISASLSLSTTTPTHPQLNSGSSGGTVSVTQWRDNHVAEQNITNDTHQAFNFLVRGKRAGTVGLINEDDTPGLVYAVNAYV